MMVQVCPTVGQLRLTEALPVPAADAASTATLRVVTAPAEQGPRQPLRVRQRQIRYPKLSLEQVLGETMPKRTNLFQRLVSEIYRTLGSGWHVQESAMLTDIRTGDSREVDVLLEARIAGHMVRLGVECRDHARRASVTWIEEMHGKHSDLPTDKVILYSASGFSDAAQKKAETLGMETVFPDSPTPPDWAQWARSCVDAKIKYVEPNFEPVVVDVSDGHGGRIRHDVTVATVLRRVADGAEVPLLSVLNQVKGAPLLRETLLDHAPEGSGDFHCVYTYPLRCEVVEGGHVLGDLDRFVIGIKTRATTQPPRTRTVCLRGRVYTLATAPMSEGELSILISEGVGEGPSLSAKRVRENGSK